MKGYGVSRYRGRVSSSASSAGSPAASSYPGERLGLPPEGSGAVASWGHRILALFVDWIACLLVAALLTGGASMTSQGLEAWLPMAVFLVEGTILTPLLGGSFGQVATRIAVVRLDRRPVSVLAALLRTFLVCLVVPPVIYNRDRRGLHDLLVGTLTIRR